MSSFKIISWLIAWVFAQNPSEFQWTIQIFQDNVSHYFEADKSDPLSDQDRINLPNIPTVIAKSHMDNYFKKMAMGVFSKLVGTEDFTVRTIFV